MNTTKVQKNIAAMRLLPKLIAGILLAFFPLSFPAASPSTAASVAAQDARSATSAQNVSLEDAVSALKERGVIKQSAYWLANARTGKKCKGAGVADLIIKAVGKKAKVSTLDEACERLHAAGLLDNPGDWKKHARKGSTCKGESVASLILNLEKFTRP